MAKRNTTIQLEESILKRARHLAVEADTSLSDWVAQLIERAVGKDSGREASKRRALAVLEAPLRLGGEVFTRDELHER